MIKLIASDLDGTLLSHAHSSISDEMFHLIEEATKRGILFVAASGRQYPCLKHLFAPVADKIAFICNNGGLVIYQGKVLKKHTISQNLVIKLGTEIDQLPGCDVLLDGETASYVLSRNEEFFLHLRDEVKNKMVAVDSLYEIPEDIVKISARNRNGIKNEISESLISRWKEELSYAYSGKEWLDFAAKESSKGTGIEVLLKHLDIDTSEAMAFGDHYNDIPMLSLVGYSYAMSNGQDAAKEVSKYTTNSVEKTVSEYLETTSM